MSADRKIQVNSAVIVENQEHNILQTCNQMDEEQGILSVVLKSVADAKANILTIHQSVPVNGIASLTLSVDVFPESDDVDDMAKQIESLKGIHYVKILARE